MDCIADFDARDLPATPTTPGKNHQQQRLPRYHSRILNTIQSVRIANDEPIIIHSDTEPETDETDSEGFTSSSQRESNIETQSDATLTSVDETDASGVTSCVSRAYETSKTTSVSDILPVLTILPDSDCIVSDRVGSVVDASQARTADEASERMLGCTRVLSDSILGNPPGARRPKSGVVAPALSHEHTALQRALQYSASQPGCPRASSAPAPLNDGIKNRGIGSHNERSQFAPSQKQFTTCCDLHCASIQSQYPIDPLLYGPATSSHNYLGYAQQDMSNSREDSAPSCDVTLCQTNHSGRNHSSHACATDDFSSAPISRTSIDAGVSLQPSLLDDQRIQCG